MKTVRPQTHLIKMTRDIPSSFNQRLYQNFTEILDSSREKHFYTSDYYKNIAQFCSENNINLSISEYLAINFFFLAQNKETSGVSFLQQYLDVEREHFQLTFLNTHINRAKQIILALEYEQREHKPQVMPVSIEQSFNKVSDILNIYLGYTSSDFELLAKAKMHDFYTKHDHLVESEEAFMTQFAAFDNNRQAQMFKTKRFQDLLGPFLTQNIAELLHHHEKETKIFQKYKRSLN